MSYYSSLLKIVSSWPGLGSVSAHKLIDALISQEHMKESLDELRQELRGHKLCPACQTPHHKKKSCTNCEYTSDQLVIFSRVIDYMIYNYIHPKSHAVFFALKGCLDHKNYFGPADIGLDVLKNYINERKFRSILFVCPSSLEGDATAFLLERSFPGVYFEQASWPNPKIPTLAGLTHEEIALIAQEIDKFSSKDS